MAELEEPIQAIADEKTTVDIVPDAQNAETIAAPMLDTKDVKDVADIKDEDIKESRDLESKDDGDRISAHDRKERKRPRFNDNINSRFDDQPESNDADEIRRQVEFYFSDSNLPIDAYLLSATGGYRNRPVELKTIHNFKRMRHFQPFSAIRDAVRASNFLDLNENDEITRKFPLDKKFTDDPLTNRKLVHANDIPRSIYAKGFGEEINTTHLDIEAFFAPYGPIRSVRLRREKAGEFKGSVFIEFGSEEAQQQFLELDPKPQWNGGNLEFMSKQEYVDYKQDGILNGTVKPNSPRDIGGNKFRGRDKRHDNRGRGRGGRGGRGYDSRKRSRSRDRRDRRDRSRSRDRRDRRDRSRSGDRRLDREDWKTMRDRDQKARRGGGRERRHSPDHIDSIKRRRRDVDETNGEGEEGERIKAKIMKVKTDEDAGENGGGASAGAAEGGNLEVKGIGGSTAGADETDKAGSGSKKRAREDNDDE